MTIRVKVIPRSSKSEIVGEMPDGTLKVKIAAPPEKGKANAALCALLSKHYSAEARIISGHTSAIKLVRVATQPREAPCTPSSRRSDT